MVGKGCFKCVEKRKRGAADILQRCGPRKAAGQPGMKLLETTAGQLGCRA